jgi:hypothetical protein
LSQELEEAYKSNLPEGGNKAAFMGIATCQGVALRGVQDLREKSNRVAST